MINKNVYFTYKGNKIHPYMGDNLFLTTTKRAKQIQNAAKFRRELDLRKTRLSELSQYLYVDYKLPDSRKPLRISSVGVKITYLFSETEGTLYDLHSLIELQTFLVPIVKIVYNPSLKMFHIEGI